MAISKREKVGIVLLVSILSLLIGILALTIERPTGPTRDFSENVIVQQRMKILQNDR